MDSNGTSVLALITYKFTINEIVHLLSPTLLSLKENRQGKSK